MKTIEQGIKESYLKSGNNAYFGNGFKSGVEFAQRWIPVDEELPTNDDRVLVKFPNGKVIVNSFDTALQIWQYQFEQNYTHWRPIEY